jgi:integration host factor subunit alpha
MKNVQTKNITKNDIAKFIYQEVGLSFSKSNEIVSAVFNEIIESLEKNEDVKISNFGTFKVRQKKARIGRNPKTKEEHIITARKSISFYASKKLKDKINS